jgi:voltage-gated potassium channel
VNASVLARPPSDAERFGLPPEGWRRRLYVVVFESDTPAGKAFDIALLAAILASITVVMLDSVAPLNARYGRWFTIAEWCFTALFTAEYLARLVSVRHQVRYATSLFGLIDLIAVLPTYIALFFPAAHALLDVRVLRLLRVFRILKMAAYVHEFRVLGRALRASRRRIFVFILFVMTVVVVMGTLMYVVEGPANGFTSIPLSVYWAIVTMTTVGFGDIVPKTDIGRFITSLVMLLGWGTLAVPTGIVTAELTSIGRAARQPDRRCGSCGSGGHDEGSRHCKDCGARL